MADRTIIRTRLAFWQGAYEKLQNAYLALIEGGVNTFLQARSTFYSLCAVAAISEVPVHSVVLLNEVGQELGLESFNHTDGQGE